jgi:hypothetical protein
MRGWRAVAACAALFATYGCSSGAGTTSSGGSTSSSSGSGDAGDCASDPLHTGLVAQQTGVSVDVFDCPILKWTAQYREPDPMIFKAIIYVESRFDNEAVACPNLPCGTPTGWTASESGCFGLMQIVPACAGPVTAPLLLPNGHPDLERDASAPDWASSVFDPDMNIHVGIAGIADNRAQVMKQFSGCTTDQYTMMAVGNFNSYGSTKSCTVYNTDYDNLVLDAYKQYSTAAGWAAHRY